MKCLFRGLLVSLIVIGIASVARADGMPDYYAAPSFNWSGVYGGVSVGGAWSSFDGRWPISDHNFVAGTRLGFDSSDVAFGGQLGVQYQWGNFVGGIELSGSGFANNLDDKILATTAPPCTFRFAGNGSPCGAEVATKWSLELVGRAGWALGRWLPYIEGGLALNDIQTREVQCCNPLDVVGNPFRQPSSYFNKDGVVGGAVVGGGLEYALTNKIIVGIDYRHVFVDTTRSGPCPDTAGICNAPAFHTFKLSGDTDTLLARVSFKMDGREPAPLK